MPARLLHSRALLAIGVLAIGFAAIGSAIVLASSDDRDPESGTLAEVRHASPPRTSAPEVVASGRTDAGQAFELLVSGAKEGGICVAVHYAPPADTPEPPVVTMRGSEFCGDPGKRPVSASLQQLFVDPHTGKLSDTPQRFAYGMTTGDAARVVVEGPGGKPDELALHDAPGGVKVFAGSVSGQPGGTGSVVAEDASGRAVGEQPLRFARPMHTSDADALREHPPELTP